MNYSYNFLNQDKRYFQKEQKSQTIHRNSNGKYTFKEIIA